MHATACLHTTTTPASGRGDGADPTVDWLPPDDILADIAAAAATVATTTTTKSTTTCPSGASAHHDLCCGDTVFACVVSGGLEPPMCTPAHDWRGLACIDGLAKPGSGGVWGDDLGIGGGGRDIVDAWADIGCRVGAGVGVGVGAGVCASPPASVTHTDDDVPSCLAVTEPGSDTASAADIPTAAAAAATAAALPAARKAPPPPPSTTASTTTTTTTQTRHRVATPIARPRKAPKKLRRTVSSPTALRLLYITKGMHRALGLDTIHPRPLPGRRANACIIHMTAAAVSGGASSCHARPFPVTMTTSTFKGHAHRRFSAGWREFCAAAGVQVGDTVTFARGKVAGHLTVTIDKKWAGEG